MALDLANGFKGLIGLDQPTQSSDQLMKLASAEADLSPGFAMLDTTRAGNAMGQENARAKDITSQMAQALQGKDYQRAISLYAQLHPEGVPQLLAQLDSLDPSLAQSITGAKKEGEYGVLSKYNSTPGQIAAIEAPAKQAKNSDLNDERMFRRQERFQDNIIKTTDKLNESTQLFDTAYSQAELALKNPEAALNLGRSIIRAIEGPGSRVSNEDFKTSLGSNALGDKLYNRLQGWTAGTIRPKTQAEVLEMLDAAKKVYAEKATKAVDLRISQAAKRFGIDKDAAEELAFPSGRPDYLKKKSAKAAYSSIQEEGISKVMKSNGISRDEAIKALKQAGKLD